jgi:malate dehydrogenase (oxaloacetate-decarboxylating)
MRAYIKPRYLLGAKLGCTRARSARDGRCRGNSSEGVGGASTDLVLRSLGVQPSAEPPVSEMDVLACLDGSLWRARRPKLSNGTASGSGIGLADRGQGWLEPSFGGINLEDIATPKCFSILERLREELHIPVWHDDQPGTAAVMLAGLINALKVVGKTMRSVTISMIGAGAANIAVSRLLIAAGVPADHLVMVDTKGILHQGREDLRTPENLVKWHFCEMTNGEGRTGGIPEAMQGTDVCIALSCPEPGLIRPAWVTSMANEAIVFACANPLPELWPWEAKEVGARMVATGRSDFANQVNDALGFPASFRGVLDVEATKITDEMCIAAAEELARCAEEKGLSEEYILPRLDDWEVFPREATAVGLKAIAPGFARRAMTQEALLEKASTLIKRARDTTRTLREHGSIPLAA